MRRAPEIEMVMLSEVENTSYKLDNNRLLEKRKKGKPEIVLFVTAKYCLLIEVFDIVLLKVIRFYRFMELPMSIYVSKHEQEITF